MRRRRSCGSSWGRWDMPDSAIEWSWVSLAELIQDDRPICYGVLKPGEFDDRGVPLIRIVDIERNELDQAKLFKITRVLDQEFARSRVVPGDLLISIQGTIGRLALVPDGCKNANISRTLARLAFKQEADGPFFRHWFLSSSGAKATDEATVGTTRSSLNLSVLRQVQVPNPPALEKQKIAQILDTLDTQIRQTEALIAKLERIKQGLLTDLLTRGLDENGQLRPTPDQAPQLYKDSPLGLIPKNWSVAELGNVAELRGGFGFPEALQGAAVGDLPFYKVSDMSLAGNDRWMNQSNNYVSEELARRMGWRPMCRGSVVFAKVGAALLLNRRRILTCDSLVDNNMMAAVSGSELDDVFLYWWMLTVDFGLVVQPGALPSVNQSQLGAIGIRLPQISEQLMIARRLDELENLISSERNELNSLGALKSGLMDDLLTGRVRVTPLLDTAEQAAG